MVANARTFRCLNCDRMIDDSMTECRYCSMRIDAGVAKLIGERQERARQSYRDASFLRWAVVALYVFVALSYIPFAPLVWLSGLGILITFFVGFGLLVRWQMKFGRLVTNDADYLKGRRSWRLSFVLWLVALPLGAFGWLLIHFLFAAATR